MYNAQNDIQRVQDYAKRSYDLIKTSYKEFVKKSLERLTSHLGDYSNKSYLNKKLSAGTISSAKYSLG